MRLAMGMRPTRAYARVVDNRALQASPGALSSVRVLWFTSEDELARLAQGEKRQSDQHWREKGTHLVTTTTRCPLW